MTLLKTIVRNALKKFEEACIWNQDNVIQGTPNVVKLEYWNWKERVGTVKP